MRGRLRPGDALLLYTDGMVESRAATSSLGIDRMLGQAEQLLRGIVRRRSRSGWSRSSARATTTARCVLVHRR